MKRTLLTSLLTASSMLSIVGYAAADSTLTIESWRTDDLAIWQEQIIPAFEAKNPGIKIVFSPTNPPEYDAALGAKLEAGSAGDLITCRPFDKSLELFKKGQLARPGLSPADLLEYNKAQGDPMGEITLEQALAGDDKLADKSKGKLFATLDTTMGKIRCELFEDQVPKTVANFVGLARGVRPYYVKKEDAWKTGNFYDGTLFHRVIPGFMLQGGDPTGTGTGGPGYEFENEDNDLTFDKPGVVAMANHGRDTNGSQFFITFGPTPQLNGGYTIFGQVVEGMDVVNGIMRRDPDQNPDFQGDAIETITITEE